MIEKEQFINLLKDILDIAKTNGNTITTEDIKKCFKDREFSKEQFDAIYDYMSKNNITVKGYIPPGGIYEDSMETEKSSHRMGMYKKSAMEIVPEDKERLKEASKRLISGDADVSDKEYIIHSYLPLVINMSVRYANRGVASDELIQEGNLALVTAVTELSGAAGDSFNTGNILEACEKYFRDKVREYIVKYIDRESKSDSEFSAAVAKASLIYEASKHLAEELGRVASLNELSEYTHIAEDEIEDIIRFSGYTISTGDGKENIT